MLQELGIDDIMNYLSYAADKKFQSRVLPCHRSQAGHCSVCLLISFPPHPHPFLVQTQLTRSVPYWEMGQSLKQRDISRHYIAITQNINGPTPVQHMKKNRKKQMIFATACTTNYITKINEINFVQYITSSFQALLYLITYFALRRPFSLTCRK